MIRRDKSYKKVEIITLICFSISVVIACITRLSLIHISLYSMALGEQITTISKDEVISKIGTITDRCV